MVHFGYLPMSRQGNKKIGRSCEWCGAPSGRRVFCKKCRVMFHQWDADNGPGKAQEV